MDTLTHVLSGALVARATAPKNPSADDLSLGARVTAGALAAAFPDSDFVLGYLSPVLYLESHRGVTHSVLLLVPWALLLAFIFAKLTRDPRGFRPWFGVCALGIGIHIFGDLITSFGTMIFAPVSDARFALGTTFIIDLWLSGLIVAGLVASLVWRRSRVPATLALVAVLGYIGLGAVAKDQAERFAIEYAKREGLEDARISVHPRPVSPFNWTVFAIHGDEVSFSHVNLLRREMRPSPGPDAGFIERLNAPYRPLEDARWEKRRRFGTDPEERSLARSAWDAHELAFFRWFADVPVFDGITSGSRCVWFRDLRFLTPGREAVPFRYGVCRKDADDRWILFAPSTDGATVPVAR